MAEQTRAYSIQIVDMETGQDVILTTVDWTNEEKRLAVAQVLRWAGVPAGAGDCFVDEVAPGGPRKRQ
jgi:hypothetical protein